MTFAWQPAAVLYPDAVRVMCDKTRSLGLGVDYVGRKVPQVLTTAIVWNRVGGVDPVGLLQVRVFAPTDEAAEDFARTLAAKLPKIVDGKPVTHLEQTGGPTDLGTEESPMRQLLYDVSLRGTQLP